MVVRKVTFSNPTLRSNCNASRAVDTKIETIKTGLASYGTPGPKSLGVSTKHTHLTNQTGIAWQYSGDGNSVEIVALGKKDNSKGGDTSGYKWCRQGNVSALPD